MNVAAVFTIYTFRARLFTCVAISKYK